MNLIGIGPLEILVIVALTLIVFGPQRMPELARYVAKAMRMFKEASREIQSQLEMTDWDKLPEKKKKSTTKPKKIATEDSYPVSDPYNYDSVQYNTTPDGTTNETEYQDPYNLNEDHSYSSGSNGKQTSTVTSTVEPLDDPAKEKDAQRYNREMSD
ncbi:MAG: twin-arginine translocase TatA/TatE family subunit [bacterium]|jgi:sec-independent protein translocase protein TatA